MRKRQLPKELEPYKDRFVAKNDKGLGTKSGHKPVSVMLPPNLDSWVRSLENRSEWIRQAIEEKYEREHSLINPEEANLAS